MQQVEMFEPSGSNDELFFRTMAGIEERDRSRTLTYRRRVLAAITTMASFAAVIVVLMDSIPGR